MDQTKTTISHLFGEMVWLLSRSPVYKRMPISDLELMVMPPIMLNQYRVFRKDKQPIGFALWAYLSEEVEMRMREKLNKKERFQLQPDEWKSGQSLWLVELVSPFHSTENKLNDFLVADLTQNVFKEKAFKFLAINQPEHGNC